MDIVCPLDKRCSGEISALLEPLPFHQIQEYYERILASRNCSGIHVREDGEYGVSAQEAFAEGELIFRDQMLFGYQHSSNEIDCLVCSSCFRFIGSVEQQIGRRLYLQYLGLSSSHGCDAVEEVMEVNVISDSSDGEIIACEDSNEESGGSASGINGERGKLRPPMEMVESLMRGEFLLPYSDKFLLPPVVHVQEDAMKHTTTDADWDSCHSLLCLGGKSKASCRAALDKFTQHANETNAIFLLAAKVVGMHGIA